MSYVAVIASQSLVRAGLSSLLKSMGFSKVDEAATLDGLRQCTSGDIVPEVALAHLSSSAISAPDLMEAIKAWAPTTKVVFIAPHLDINLLSECFACGASGYLLEDLSPHALQMSLTLVASGEKVFPSGLASVLANAVKRDIASNLPTIESCNLSCKELGILRLLADGRSNKMIAASLNIAESTAKLHLRNILRKLHATNRTQAALWAAQRGILADANPVGAEAKRQDNLARSAPAGRV